MVAAALLVASLAVAADGRSATADYGRGRKWKLHLAVAEGGTISLASGQKGPRLSGWFVGRNDLTIHPATTISVKARGRARDHVFVTELKAVRAGRADSGGVRRPKP